MTSGILRKLPEVDPNFSNSKDALELFAERQSRQDSDRLKYFKAYAAANYNSSLTPGFGTEELLDLLAGVPTGVDWLDLGAGTTSLFWTAALERCTSITAVDVFPEALVVLRGIVEQGDISDCMVDALARYDRPRSHIASARSLDWRYLVYDFAQRWPEQINLQTYDLITAFGCFGLGPHAPEHFKKAMANTAPYIAPKGLILGANWLRTEDSIAREGYDTSFLTDAFIAEQCSQIGMTLEYAHVVRFAPEPRFSGVLLWKVLSR